MAFLSPWIWKFFWGIMPPDPPPPVCREVQPFFPFAHLQASRYAPESSEGFWLMIRTFKTDFGASLWESRNDLNVQNLFSQNIVWLYFVEETGPTAAQWLIIKWFTLQAWNLLCLYNVNHLPSFSKIRYGGPLECHKKGYFQSLDTPVDGFFVEMKFYTSTRT